MICFLWLFMVFDQFSIYSDNFYYADAFNELSRVGIKEGVKYFIWRTAGTEPLSILTFYIASKVISYKCFIFIVDTLFVFILLKLLTRYKVNIYYGGFVVLTNFYIVVLSIGVHRVKLAILVLCLGLVIDSSKPKVKLILFGLAGMFHLQVFTVFCSSVCSNVMAKLCKFKLQKKHLLMLFLLLLIAIFAWFYTGLPSKLLGRVDLHFVEFLIALSVSVAFLVTFQISDIKWYFFLFIVSVVIFVVGGFRMNMILILSFYFITLITSKLRFYFFSALLLPFMIYKIYTLYINHYLSNLIL